jgi:hypothetical protein
MKWLRDSLLDEEKNELYEAKKKNYTLLTCSALTFEQRFSIYGEIMT